MIYGPLKNSLPLQKAADGMRHAWQKAAAAGDARAKLLRWRLREWRPRISDHGTGKGGLGLLAACTSLLKMQAR